MNITRKGAPMTTPTHPPTTESADHDFVISRTFAAPRELVFKAWIN
jgi:hypothetical protein